MYAFYVYALHVWVTQGHLQATLQHIIKKCTGLCTLSIALLKYADIIIHFGVTSYDYASFHIIAKHDNIIFMLDQYL
jgi:hypothetical protein